MLFGNVVVPPGGIPAAIAGVLLIGAIGCWVAVWLFWVRQSSPRILGFFGWLRALTAGFGSISASIIGITALFLVGVVMVNQDYKVLAGRSPDGCTLVRYQGDTSADVFIKKPGSPKLIKTGAEYRISDSDPIEAGDWSLTWDGPVGKLTVGDQQFQVTCPTENP
jgi:hypothetical protein